MVPTHFHDVAGDLSDNNVGKSFWIIQNSDSDLVTSCFARILTGITRSLILFFLSCSLAALIHLQVVLEL